MNEFEKAIKKYLDNRATSDQLFAAKYTNEKKSIEECCRYIISEVKKSGREGYAHDEIYGMAVHYYDEETLDIKNINCKVVITGEVNPVPETAKQAVAERPTMPAPRAPFTEPEKRQRVKKSIDNEFQLSLFD